MKKTLLVAASFAVLLGAAPGPAAAASHQCKAVSARNAQALLSTRDLRAGSGVGCRGARRLVLGYFRSILAASACYRVPGSCRFRGWDFQAREGRHPYKLYVRATRGAREIAFRRVDRPLQG